MPSVFGDYNASPLGPRYLMFEENGTVRWSPKISNQILQRDYAPENWRHIKVSMAFSPLGMFRYGGETILSGKITLLNRHGMKSF